jgi:hypothetical protein
MKSAIIHDAIINYRNNHLWSYENPHGIIKSQHKFSCNVWADMLKDFLLGLIFLSATLNGNNYRQFLERNSHTGQETQLHTIISSNFCKVNKKCL